MGPLPHLPTELIAGIVTQLHNIEDFLALRSTSRRLYRVLTQNTTPRITLDLLAVSAPTFCSPHPHFLVAALARQISEWTLADYDVRVPLLQAAFRGGIDSLFEFCLDHAPRGLSLDEIRRFYELRFAVMNPLTDAIDRMAGPQWYQTEDFWAGGVSEPSTLYTEPSRSAMQILIYGELFGPSFDYFLDKSAWDSGLSPTFSSRSFTSTLPLSTSDFMPSDGEINRTPPVFKIADRLEFVKYCIPDWLCHSWGDFLVEPVGPYRLRRRQPGTSSIPADQQALRHVLTCRRWRRMWRDGMAKVNKDDFSPPLPASRKRRRTSIIEILTSSVMEPPSPTINSPVEPKAHHWADHFSYVGDENRSDMPNLSAENWRQKLYRDALVFQGIEGMQLVTLPAHKISDSVLQKARWIRQKIAELDEPIEMTPFGRLTPMLVSSAPDLSQELWLGKRGTWRESVNM
ncbi:hypothetical protein BGW36DRAFT_426593 [Talaromyces proteolyticus]|uniref:F-box domain-containing protein n=1 Tax=Talaromyces proteolyticus TaxID=1131652 RepID=A0AAD4Q1V6_9EURO|nr:uncharacterized protein BGW36DRAFT_426593 [Talaromyces proteolyticus]KAH8698910.1 hypothetical protein BGW36DRAFT_426593 [Talaromyces proteolyticus]